eukprot:4069288-Amphidinium_carterae.1
MPPLEYVNAASTPAARGSASSAAGPSPGVHEQVGGATSSAGVRTGGGRTCATAASGEKPAVPKPGEKVRLKGLSKSELNGKEATVLSEMHGTGRIAVKLQGSVQKLSIRLENMQVDDGEASDDSMPPLEYVGSSKPEAQKSREEAESDDSMPPLEYVGSKPQAPARTRVESDDSMPPLEYVGSKPQAQKESAE